MSILPPHLDPYATGDHDTHCRECDENIDNPRAGIERCPHIDDALHCTNCATTHCDECAHIAGVAA